MKVTDITTEKTKRNGLIRLAAYCRVSSDSADQLHSFVTQIRYYGEYTQTHPEYTLVDIYADEGLTGTDMSKREDFNRLIRDCKKDKIDRIIVKSVARFARNTEELLVTLRLLDSLGISVYFEETGIDTELISLEMIVTLPGMAAQQESEAISGNLRWSYDKRMKSGEFNCCSPAYGFKLVDGKSLVVNEAEAIIVKRVFDMYLQGLGTLSIARILNDEKVPRRYDQKRWYSSTIMYMLTNERYMGDVLLQKKYTTDTLPYRKKLNRGEKTKYYVENSNPSIVSKETYDAVQRLIKSRQFSLGTNKTVYLLTAKMRCPECGHVHRRQVTNGIVYWHCSGKSAGRTLCASHRVREDMVYESFMNMAIKLKDNRKYLLGSLINNIQIMQNKTSINQERISQIDKEIADLTAQNLVIARLHTSGILNAIERAAQSSEINNKVTALRVERRKKMSEDEEDELLENLKILNKIFEEWISTYDFDQGLFEQIVEEIIVDDNTKITFRLMGGIKFTEKINEKGVCRTV